MAAPIEIISTPAGGSPVTVEYPVNEVEVTSTGGGAGGGGLTDAELRATAVPVSGPLTNTQLRATAIPVAGPVTNAELRATPVPVDTGGLTNAELRASEVPVSGPLTDTQLRAAPIIAKPLENTITGAITTQNLVPTGVATAGSAVVLDVDNGSSEIGIQVSGTYSGALSVQATINGTLWVTLPAIIGRNVGTSAGTIPSAAVGLYSVPNHGFAKVRVTALAALTGSAAIAMRAASGTRGVDSLLTNATIVSVLGTPSVVGPAAASAPASGNPVRIAARAMTSYDATLVNGDVADFVAALNGAIVNRPYSLPDHDWQSTATLTTAASTAMKGAGPAGVRNYVTGFQYQNTAATATEIRILDGLTVVARFQAPASMALPAAITFPTPLRGTGATALNVLTVTAAANVHVNVQGFQAP